MLKELRHYHNLGTPNYFFQLLKSVNDSENINWSLNDLDSLFYNRVIDDNHIFDGCVDLAVRINVLIINGDYYTVNNDFSDSLNSVNQMKRSNLYKIDSDETFRRRASTILSWINWVIEQIEE